MMSFSAEEDDDKRGGRVRPSRIKRRTTHRLRTKPNARSRNSTRSDKGAERQVDRIPPNVRISNETDLYENKYEGADVALWDRMNEKNDDADDDMQIYVRESFNNYHGGLEFLLARLIVALENNSREDDPEMPSSSAIDNAGSFDDEDRCQKWLDNWEKIEKAFPGKQKQNTSQSCSLNEFCDSTSSRGRRPTCVCVRVRRIRRWSASVPLPLSEQHLLRQPDLG